MKKFTFTLISAFILAPVSTMAWTGAGMGMGGGGCGMGPGICWSSEIPNLTAEQSVKLSDLQKSFIQETAQLRGELAIKRIELNQLLAKPQSTPEEIMAKQSELINLQSKLQQKCLSKNLEIRKIIPEEDRREFPYGFAPQAYPFPKGMQGYCPSQGWGYGHGRGGM